VSTNPPTLTREQWRTVLDDTDLPTFGELWSTIEAATMIDAEGDAADQLVDEAVGDLLEADPEASGMFDVFRLETGENDENGGVENAGAAHVDANPTAEVDGE
jgi:hypothetical protein